MENLIKNIDFIHTSLYDGLESASNGGVAMTAQEALAAAFIATGNTQADGARAVGWRAQQLNQRLSRDSLRASDFFRILDTIGVDFHMTVRETGKPIRIHTPGYGRKIRAMSGRVMYNTATSDAISNSFFEDGVHEFGADGKASELYIDREGRYFLAEYSNIEGEKDKVRAINGDLAAAFIEKYGTTIDKRPKTE